MPHLVETLEEYRQRHGEAVSYNGHLLFQSGATASLDLSARNEPPPEKLDRLKLRREFWRVREERAERQFHGFQFSIQEQQTLYNRYGRNGLGSICPPPANADETADGLRQQVLSIRETIVDIEAQIEDARPKPSEKQLEAEQRLAEIARERDLRIARALELTI